MVRLHERAPMKRTLGAFAKTALAYTIWSLFGPVLNLSTFSVNQNIWSMCVIGVLVIAIYALYTKQLKQVKRIRLNIAFFLFLVTSGVSGVLWLTALTLVPIGQATFLWSTIPLVTLLLAVLLLKEKVNSNKLVALLMGLLGVGVVVSTNFGMLRMSSLLFVGFTYIAVGIFLKALQAVIIKRYSVSYPAWLTSGLIILSQIVCTTPFVLFQPWHVSQLSILAVIALGLLSTLAFFLFVSSFSVLTSSSVMMAGFFEPFLASLWGYLFLHQILSPWVFVGGIFILASGYFVSKSETR